MDDTFNDFDNDFDGAFNEPTGSNDDFFIPENHAPDARDWSIIGPMSEEEAWRIWERKWIERNNMSRN